MSCFILGIVLVYFMYFQWSSNSDGAKTVIIDSNIDSTNGFSGYSLHYHVLNIDPTVSFKSMGCHGI